MTHLHMYRVYERKVRISTKYVTNYGEEIRTFLSYTLYILTPSELILKYIIVRHSLHDLKN